MDAEILARIQFALTIMFHYIYAPISIGLSLFVFITEGLYLATRNPAYKRITTFWIKPLGLTFVFGVATGIVMEFEFGTNWSNYSRFVGDIFGSPLLAEGLFSFFLESVFIGIMVYGVNRVSETVHFFSTAMVALGAHLSAVWIVVANSWMHTPAGYHIVGEQFQRHAIITDFLSMFFNPSAMDRLAHVLIGAWLAGAFIVIGVSAYHLYRKKAFAAQPLKIALFMAGAALILQIISGDHSARMVATTQPIKLAAFEGIFTTQSGAPLSIAGIVNADKNRIDYAIAIPKLLSLLAYHDASAQVQGLDTVPPQDRPHVSTIFYTYHLMILMWGSMAACVGLAYVYWKTLPSRIWLLRLLMLSAVLPQLANQAGWVATEMGRYPWIVSGLLRISEGVSRSVSASQVLGSAILFSLLYLVLFSLYLLLFGKKVATDPIIGERPS